MSKYTAYIMIGLARILGGMSLLVFMIFLFVGSLNLLDMHLDESGVLWFDAGLSLLFFIQHSGMIRKPFHRWFVRFIPEDYAGAIYAIVSGIVLLLVILLWQTSTQTIISPSGHAISLQHGHRQFLPGPRREAGGRPPLSAGRGRRPRHGDRTEVWHDAQHAKRTRCSFQGQGCPGSRERGKEHCSAFQ